MKNIIGNIGVVWLFCWFLAIWLQPHLEFFLTGCLALLVAMLLEWSSK